jgi:hypothetical protein
MTIKFRFIDRFERFGHYQYYLGKSKNAKIEVTKRSENKYSFMIDREKDDFVFNSLWGSHSNELYQKLLNELPDMKFNNDAEALEFIDQWVQNNVPKLEKKS